MLAEMDTTSTFRLGHIPTFIYKNSRSLPVALIYLFCLRHGLTSEGRKLFSREILFPYLNPIDAGCGSSSDTPDQRLALIFIARSKTLSIGDIAKNRRARNFTGMGHGEFQVADGLDQKPKKYPAPLYR